MQILHSNFCWMLTFWTLSSKGPKADRPPSGRARPPMLRRLGRLLVETIRYFKPRGPSRFMHSRARSTSLEAGERVEGTQSGVKLPHNDCYNRFSYVKFS